MKLALTTHQKRKLQAMATQKEAFLPEKQPIKSSPQARLQHLHRQERLAK